MGGELVRKLIALSLILLGLLFAVDKAVLNDTLAAGLFDDDGNFLSSGKVYFYQAGTTTAKDTYSDSNKGATNTNPVVLDAYGRSVSVYMDTYVAYKLLVKTSAGVTIDVWDDVHYQSVGNDITGRTINTSGSLTATNMTVTGNTNGKGYDWKTSTGNTLYSIYREAGELDIDFNGTRQLGFKNGVTADFDVNIDAPKIVVLDLISSYSTLNICYVPTATVDVFIGSPNFSDGIDSGGNGVSLKFKVINIGDWNMDATPNIEVVHGLTAADIRDAGVTIRNDAGNAYFPIEGAEAAAAANGPWGSWQTTSNYFLLNRIGSLTFDSADFDAVGYNRGWITAWYTN